MKKKKLKSGKTLFKIREVTKPPMVMKVKTKYSRKTKHKSKDYGL